MYVKNLKDCEKFTSGDNAILRELLHPAKMKGKFRYSLAHAIVKPGKITLKHKLRTTEVYYILSGTGKMYIDDETKKVGAGDAVYIPPHAVQQIKNIGKKDLVFICMVDPAWRIEDEEIIES